MKRSRLENIYFKKQDNLYLRAYKSKKIIVVDYIKKKEKNFFNNLNPRFVSDNKLFRKTVKPLLSSKGSYNANKNLLIKMKLFKMTKRLQKY